jgi:hypothetical protein
MTGSSRNVDTEAALVCLHLNFETKNSKIGMLDSGCNNAMQVLTDDVRECVVGFDTNGRITGDQVNGEFTTDASGTLGITLNGVSPAGSVFAFDFVVEKMQLVRNLSYNLFPASFFTRRGVMCFFTEGRVFTITIRLVLEKFDSTNCNPIPENTWDKLISNHGMTYGSSIIASSILLMMWQWQHRSPMLRKFPPR